MISTSNNRQIWINRFKKERSFYETYEEQFPVWENWQRNSCPNLEAQRCLEHALDLLYADAPHALIDNFLGWSIELIDRGFAEDKFRPETSRGSFPRNRGEGLRARVYAKALLGGELLTDDLLLANCDCENWCKDISSGRWDSVTECRVTAPARLSLIAGDFERFAELLPFRFRIKWHKEEADLLMEMNEFLRLDRPIPPDIADRFAAYFERIRNPEFKPDIFTETDILRFELGILYCKHVATDEPFSWQRVIDEIAR